MAKNPILQALPDFAGGDEPWQKNPFITIIDDKNTWSVATDGAMILAAKSKSTYPEMDNHYFRAIAKFLTHKENDPLKTDFQSLKRWVETVPKAGEDPEEDPPKGVFFGKVFNTDRIHKALSAVPETDVLRVWDSTTLAGVNSMVLEGDGWRFVVAALDKDVESEPKYDLTQPHRVPTVFELAMQLGAEDDPITP